jgi:hypothetical protein
VRDSAWQQVKSGLRWGGGLAAFLFAMLPLIDGLRRTVWASRSGQTVEMIGLIELLVAAGVLVLTANIWVYYLLGCMIFGAIKGVALVAMGGGASLQTLELLVFILLTTLLLVGTVLRPTTSFDRTALTLFCIFGGMVRRYWSLCTGQVLGRWPGNPVWFVVHAPLETVEKQDAGKWRFLFPMKRGGKE